MNVLFITALDLKEAGAQSLRETIKGYLKAKYKISFITYKKGNEPDYFYEKDLDLKSENLTIMRISLPFQFLDKTFYTRRIRLSLIFPFLASKKAGQIINNEKIDLLYGYEIHGVLTAKIIKRFLKDVPMVSRFQGTMLYPMMKARTSLMKYQDHVTALKYPADLVIMTDDGTHGDEVLEALRVDKEKVRFWRNGVSDTLFNPKLKNWLREKYKLDSKVKILLTVSRLVDWKRVDRAIEALKYVSTEVSAILFVVGDGPSRPKLEEMVKEMNLSEKVIFVGSISNTQVHKFLNSCDVFLSLYDLSNLGNPVMEGMRCGKCVLTINRGEMTKIIKNGETGILVEKEENIGKALLEILKDDSLRESIGKKALESSKKIFWTWSERMDAEINEVEKILK